MNALFDEVKKRRNLRSDSHLAVLLKCHRSFITHVRKGNRPLPQHMLNTLREKANLTQEDIEQLTKEK